MPEVDICKINAEGKQERGRGMTQIRAKLHEGEGESRLDSTALQSCPCGQIFVRYSNGLVTRGSHLGSRCL